MLVTYRCLHGTVRVCMYTKLGLLPPRWEASCPKLEADCQAIEAFPVCKISSLFPSKLPEALVKSISDVACKRHRMSALQVPHVFKLAPHAYVRWCHGRSESLTARIVAGGCSPRSVSFSFSRFLFSFTFPLLAFFSGLLPLNKSQSRSREST
ncbi:hypothetical protein N656DRAFT_272544 [Canariomyces notabilis]|uniref:Uncharacterized protein n=1 Tax=Canariomyces notabilis TaxID=2074819 RepID=A0AAN6TLR4_9PEZI|nr:hypothetical protein N656DRAFT_272544 [Canariomyces arenarius]